MLEYHRSNPVIGLRNEALVIFAILFFTIPLSGCSTKTPNVNSITPVPCPSIQTPNPSTLIFVPAYGHVYLNGNTVKGASVEAISANETDHISGTTNDTGAYILNLKPDTRYNITATYQGLRHTVWPVYLPGETGSYDINLTTTPQSTIEGSGYSIVNPGPDPLIYDMNDHKRWSGIVIRVTSVKDNTTITALTDNNGNYSLKVEPNIVYNITSASSLQNKFPIPMIHYRNYGGLTEGYFEQIMVGPNETALVDYEIPLP
jgi:hypothetical protein